MVAFTSVSLVMLFLVNSSSLAVNTGRFFLLTGLTLVLDDLPDVSKRVESTLNKIKSQACRIRRVFHVLQFVTGAITFYIVLAIAVFEIQHPSTNIANYLTMGTLLVTSITSFACVKRKSWLKITPPQTEPALIFLLKISFPIASSCCLEKAPELLCEVMWLASCGSLRIGTVGLFKCRVAWLFVKTTMPSTQTPSVQGRGRVNYVFYFGGVPFHLQAWAAFEVAFTCPLPLVATASYLAAPVLCLQNKDAVWTQNDVVNVSAAATQMQIV